METAGWLDRVFEIRELSRDGSDERESNEL